MTNILLAMMESGKMENLMDTENILIRMITNIWETLKTDRRQAKQSYSIVMDYTTKEKSS